MKNIFYILITILFFSCIKNENNNTNSTNATTQPDSEVTSPPTPADETTPTNEESSTIINPYKEGIGLDIESLKNKVDLNMDITQLSLSDIRILRNSFAARQGYCFMKADLRAIYNTTSWYDEIMDNRYWQEEDGTAPDITYSEEEQTFIEKLKQREKELMADNFINNKGNTSANLKNIINLFQLEKPDPKLMGMLEKNGFAIVPNNNIQHFHVYEKNDYQQFPNFVTTDMYMQLFHMYFGFVLRKTEEEKFIPILKDITNSMLKDMNDFASKNTDPEIKKLAEHNATYYAIAHYILTENKTNVPASFKDLYQKELKNIEAAKDNTSEFLEYKDVAFPYSLFKPRGHYTRTEGLKKYFKAMMWLQTAPYCLDNDAQLKRAALSAWLLVKSPNYGEKTLKKYKSIMEPINFIIGQPDNVSFLNLARIMQRGSYDIQQILNDPSQLERFRKEVKKIADDQNVIKPKQALSCVDKINFIPQRYLADNEIMQELVDANSLKTQRGYPKGLDVMAAFGSKSAENILLNELKENEKWDQYGERLSQLKTKMKNTDWNYTLYNNWIKSLLDLQQPNKKYPYFMQNDAWKKKDLNASLSSWAELKHDAILYAEQPFAAECGAGGPPAPYTVGYVEPNTAYWNGVLELLDLTQSVLEKNNLMTDKIKSITKSMKENAAFLLSASEKELKGEKLSNKEYQQIEFIGSTFEWLTLDLVKQKDEFLSGWNDVKGPDKSVAVVADVYTSNSTNNINRGIMHVATGHVNDIYVVVEIEGYLYLTKGAVFSYHEFNLPLGNRLTDEEWQKMLEENKAPETPDWIQEIIVPIDAPKSNEKIFYSSGC